MANKKLIEVALPLEIINSEASSEKSIRSGHPSTLHLWWSRKPTAAARAVLFASLVDDPSSHKELFPTEKDQIKERERLFGIIKDIIPWKNANDEKIINEAKKEIEKYCGEETPAVLDPFAGGGAIPFEAQRLGLKTYAHDLNPVAVMINKAMIDLPLRFAGRQPVNPESRTSTFGLSNAKGLAEDVRYYGELLKRELYEKIGQNYPKVNDGKNQDLTVIAWMWTRVVKCPNPACAKEVPLFNSLDLSTKKGHETHIEIFYDGKEAKFDVTKGKSKIPGTINRSGAKCPCCGSPIDFPYLRSEGKSGRMFYKLAAIVAEEKRGRIFLPPNFEHEKIADIDRPEDVPHAEMPYNPRNFNTPLYGMENFEDVFTNRQLLALTTLSKLLPKIQNQIKKDAIGCGMSQDEVSLSQGGLGIQAYSEAVITYLAFAIDKASDAWSSLVGWRTSVESTRNTFSLQALPMVWSFAEVNPFSSSCGNWSDACIDSIYKFLNQLICNERGEAQQADAQTDCGLRNVLISTDPPYYDNIVYGDLSDYFYMWMRHSLKNIYPDIFSTVVSPKSEELVATPYRFDGDKEEACQFFEDGMTKAFKQIYQYSTTEYPTTIYYAYKQQEGERASGWETMLSAIINSGFVINGTWPMRTEKVGRTNSNGSNALASSIVLVCRKRPENAPQTTRRNFINELKRELKPALQKLQQSNIAPVDLAQSAIGPGMAVFSKYKKVLEADGSPMSVRSALQIINQELDIYFNEQDGELDRDSRFCVELYTQNAFNDIKFGDADTLARAKNTSVAGMVSKGVLYAQKGVVHLLSRDEISDKVQTTESMIWLLTQQLTYAMEKGGIEACAKIVAPMFGSNAEYAKSLAYRLYTIAERKGWAQEAYAYNSLVVAWPDIQSRAAQLQEEKPKQMSLFDYMNDTDNA